MWKKYGKFYADWTDPNGQRRRRAFPTKAAAENHQRVQRNETRLKNAKRKAPLATSPRGGKPKTQATANAASQGK